MITPTSYNSSPSTYFSTYNATIHGLQKKVCNDFPKNEEQGPGLEISRPQQPKNEKNGNADLNSKDISSDNPLYSRSAKTPLGRDRRRVYFLTPQLVGVSEMESIIKVEMERFGAIKRVKLFCNELGVYKGFGFCDFEEEAYRFFTLQLKSINMRQGPYEIIFKINKKKVRQASRFLDTAPEHSISHLEVFPQQQQGTNLNEKRTFEPCNEGSDPQVVRGFTAFINSNQMASQQGYHPKGLEVWSPDVLTPSFLPSLFLKNKEPAVFSPFMLESRKRKLKSPQENYGRNQKKNKMHGCSGGSQTLAKIHAQDLSRMANVILVSERTEYEASAKLEYYLQNEYRFRNEYLIKRLCKFIDQKLGNDNENEKDGNINDI